VTPPASPNLGARTVREWLRRHLPEAQPPFHATRITGGLSMLTYRVADAAGHEWVLRLPPAGQHSGGAHDPTREARAMRALWPTPVPVPRVRVVGSRDDPLGLPCHLTDFVAGHILEHAATARDLLGDDALRRATLQCVQVLADLHRVQPGDVGLANFAPEGDYIGRQLHRWTRVLGEHRGGRADAEVAQLERLGEHLSRRRPTRHGERRIVHGDYRLGNTITGPDGTIRAVLDWELVTIGDPLSDVGTLAAFWDPPERAMLARRPATAVPPSLSRAEALDVYAGLTGTDLAEISYHEAMGCWRLGVMAVRAADRFARGQMGAGDGTDADTGGLVVAAGAWAELAGARLRDAAR
jgi:aminoglycoside phosphotransferase (APT) family kinase protein